MNFLVIRIQKLRHEAVERLAYINPAHVVYVEPSTVSGSIVHTTCQIINTPDEISTIITALTKAGDK